jgi:hypothetical protein
VKVAEKLFQYHKHCVELCILILFEGGRVLDVFSHLTLFISHLPFFLLYSDHKIRCLIDGAIESSNELPSCLSVTNAIEVCNLKMLTVFDTAIVNELHGEPGRHQSKRCRPLSIKSCYMIDVRGAIKENFSVRFLIFVFSNSYVLMVIVRPI